MLLVAAIFFFNVSVAQGADLLEIYELALQNDPGFAIVGSTLEVTRSQLEQSKSMLRPHLSLSAKPQIIRGTEHLTSSNFNISITQSLFDYDSWNAVDESAAYVSHDEAELKEAGQELMAHVSRVYFDLLAAEEGVRLAEAETRSVKLQLQELQQKYHAGYATVAELYGVQAAHDLILAEGIEAQSALDNAREAVYEITGEDPGGIAVLKEDIPLVMPDPEDINAWVHLALEKNLDIIAQQATIEALGESLSRARAGYMPSLDLVAGYTFSDTTGAKFGKKTSNQYIGVELTVSPYSGGLTTAKVKEATEKYIQAQTVLEKIQRETTSKVRRAYLAVHAGIAQVKARQRYIVSSRAMLEATQDALKAGSKTQADLLDAQRDMYHAETELARARYDYLLSVLTLKQVVGSLSYSDIKSVNDLLK